MKDTPEQKLSANARRLIGQLLSLPQGWVTAETLAESIGVSRRTVLRELPAVEQWMQAAGARFTDCCWMNRRSGGNCCARSWRTGERRSFPVWSGGSSS